jgi:hypothetical protein
MLTVGIAIRLGLPPSEVERWPMKDLADVAAYCQLELEDLKKGTTSRDSSAPRTTTQSFRFVVKKKE